MRFISALLCFCLTFNVMAASGTVQELEKAIDDYQFALTVEWDQKDATVMTEKTDAFYQTLSQLMMKGLTQNEVMNLVTAKTKNPKELEALTIKMKMFADKASSSTDLAQIITDNSKEFYSHGASWSGYATASVGAFIVIGALIGYSMWWDSKHTCVATAQGTQCGWVSQYQNGPQYYQCWTTTYCTQYVEN